MGPHFDPVGLRSVDAVARMSRTMAEKYMRRIRRTRRVALVGNWITAVVSAVFVPFELYAGRPLHAIYFLLFLWSACRDLGELQRKVVTVTIGADTAKFEAESDNVRRSVATWHTTPAKGSPQ